MARDGPPVPAKDPPAPIHPKSATPLAMPSSGSKRKRDTAEDSIAELQDGPGSPSVVDAHTPKRSRSYIPNADHKMPGAEDGVSSKQQSLRRKRGMSNLSHASFGHSSSLPPVESPTRESRFQEGSLTDKPSEQPPSVFMRFTRTNSGNPRNVDQLMADYHDNTMLDGTLPASGNFHDGSEASNQAKNENGNFFRFGRSLAANFHPVALWNRIWNEQKQELARQDLLEAERKALLKAEVEARYAQMKKDGTFNAVTTLVKSVEESPIPRDSGVAIRDDDPRTSQEQRAPSRASFQLPPPTPDVNAPEATSDIFGSITKPLRSIRSRLHLKRPSLANLRHDLRRAASEIDLSAAASRTSLPPNLVMSPNETDGFELRKSPSKAELKKASKLSQRVSDLEVKLQRARQELNDALVEASPMPKLGNRYERFTPTNTVRRLKFVPGALPSLPSERVLLGAIDNDGDVSMAVEGNDGTAIPLSTFEGMDEETIRAPRDRHRPAHASTLFQSYTAVNEPQSARNLEQVIKQEQGQSEIPDKDATAFAAATDDDDELNMLTPTEITNDTPFEDTAANANRTAKGKKRKSFLNEADRPFKPAVEDEVDDDLEWETAKDGNKSKKKRRASAKPAEHQASAQEVASTAATAEESNGNHTRSDASHNQTTSFHSPTSSHSSIDSLAGHRLEPLYEEAEEEQHLQTTLIPVKDVPSKPTAKSTPARYGRNLANVTTAIMNKQLTDRTLEITTPGRERKTSATNWDSLESLPDVLHSGASSNRNTPSELIVAGGKTLKKSTRTLNGDRKRNYASPKQQRASKQLQQQPDFQWPDDVF